MSEGIEVLSKAVMPMELADRQTCFAALVGLEHPAAREAATAAQEWIRPVGAHGLERIWADGLPGEEVADRAG